MERFIDSFNQVIARHDILRTAVLWEKLREPVQVVYRQAVLPLKWVDSIDSRPLRIDVRQAPMFQATARYEPESGRWLLTLLGHHMVDDNTTLQHLVQEIALIQQGRKADLPHLHYRSAILWRRRNWRSAKLSIKPFSRICSAM
ncbi:MAG: condensation domain-containing protein [Cellvibrionaceae bacterium]|nr:condensation domain-containing protein [Cellvibrionaceae bacterium]